MRPSTRKFNWPWSCWRCLIWTGATRWHTTDWLFRWRYGNWPLCTRIEHQRWRVHDASSMWEDAWGAITALVLSRPVKIIFACGLVFIWVGAREHVAQMNSLFFQESIHGAKGLLFYLTGSYSNAAKAYRAHFVEEYKAGQTSGDAILDALVRGDLPTAKAYTQQALENDPDNLQTRLDLGEIALAENDLGQALDIFERILKTEPDHIDTLLLASIAYARAGNTDQAIDALNRALRNDRIGSRLTGFLMFLETTGALSHLPDRQKPLCLLAQYYRYLLFYDQSNGTPAIEYAQRALTAGDHPADAYLAIGIVHQKQGRQEQALQALYKAIEANPKHAEAYRWAATVYTSRGDDLLNAYRMWKGGYEAAPDDLFYTGAYITFLHRRMGDLKQALTISLKSLERWPDNPMMLRHVADLYQLLGEYELAIAHYRQLLVLQPENAEIYDQIGYSLAELDRTEEAIAAFQTALSLAPNRAESHIGLGVIFQRNHRHKEAITEFEAALRFGESVDVRSMLCSLFLEESQYQRAADCFRLVIAQDPNNRVALNLLPYTLKNLRPQEFQ